MKILKNKELVLSAKILLMLIYLLALYLAPGILSQTVSIFEYARF